MKKTSYFLLLCFFFSGAKGKETNYTGSTPADNSVRSFLGIPMGDSVDFIRWQLALNDGSYKLNCNYGICKNNTNGFINGGKTIELSGAWGKDKKNYQLHSGEKTLKLVQVNTDLLHITDENNNLLVGNGGWSYTLNNTMPVNTDEVFITATPTVFRDSLSFQGRTPCNISGIVPAGTDCYKLKWYIALYTNDQKSESGTYRIKGTVWRQGVDRTGNWKLVTAKNGKVFYQLNDEKGDGFVYLLKVDEHILVFTDASGKLLVGNEDFSYTMNGIQKH
jgi:hypothetical protein